MTLFAVVSGATSRARFAGPSRAQDLEREEAGDDDGLPDDGVARNSKTTSKLTLKRMRDSRKVRGMIEAFQSPTSETDRVSTIPSMLAMAEDTVRDQTQQLLSEADEKKLSLRRPLRPRRSTADFPWLEGAMARNQRTSKRCLPA